jgi:F-type H+-transporting ATPase subunit delta
LKVLIENQRLAVLPQVALQFRRLKNHAEGVADCLIESAFPISDAQVAELLASLAKFGQKLKPESGECEPDRRRPRHRGNQVLDGSVRARLTTCRRRSPPPEILGVERCNSIPVKSANC